MVLLACYECSNDVSSSAEACPKCGAPFEPQIDAQAEVGELPPEAPLPPMRSTEPAAEKNKRSGSKAGNVVFGVMLLGAGGYFGATGTQGGGSLLLVLGLLFLGSALPQTALGLKPKVVCKFCNTAGQVLVTLAERKRGVSGGKATGAILTGGLSLFLTGLSRKETVSRLNCKNCGMNWDE